MLIIETRRLVWSDRLVFFADDRQTRDLMESTDWNEITRVRQSPLVLDGDRRVLESQAVHTTCIDLTKDLDGIFAAMDRKSARHCIKKCEQMADRITIARDSGGEARAQFLVLYNDFVEHKNFTHSLTRKRLAEYATVSDIWITQYDGTPLCAHLVITDREVGRARLIYSANIRLQCPEQASLCASLNRYLHWQEIQHYKGLGFKSFDLGGIGDGKNSIARFKLAFGGEIVHERAYVFGSGLAALAYRVGKRLAH